MHWIFPMAGNGARTQARGRFKPFISVAGEPVVRWMLKGLRPLIAAGDVLLFVTTRGFELDFGVESGLRAILQAENLNNPWQLFLPEHTPPGPAATVYEVRAALLEDDPCIVVNCDQMVYFELKRDLGQHDGFLPVYFGSSPASAYALIENGLVRSIEEKVPLSCHASAGVYGFGSARALLAALEAQFSVGYSLDGEHYLGPAMNHLIRAGGRIYPTTAYLKLELGSLPGLERFEQLFGEQQATRGLAR